MEHIVIGSALIAIGISRLRHGDQIWAAAMLCAGGCEIGIWWGKILARRR